MPARSDPKSKPPPAPYRVEYAVRVWKQLLGLPEETIQRLGQELQRLAERAAVGEGQGQAGKTARMDVPGVDVTYEVSAVRQVVTVLDVSEAPDRGLS